MTSPVFPGSSSAALVGLGDPWITMLKDPRLGMAGIFLPLSRVLPAEYPLRDGIATYVGAELGFG